MPFPIPQILDVTVRDGSNLINHQYTPQMVAHIVKGLETAGIAYTEVGHGLGIGAKGLGYPAAADDEELLRAAKNATSKIKFTIFISPFSLALAVIPGVLDFFDIGRIGLNVNQVSLGKKFISQLKKYNKIVSVQLVRCHARPPEEVAMAAKLAVDMGADIIYVVDSFGSMLPGDVKTYMESVRAEVKVSLGFHGHDNLGLAMANTLTAWKNGATWLDASLMGVGRGAGNTNLEALVLELQKQKQAQEISINSLCQTTQEVILPIFGEPPVSNHIDLLFALERLDFPSPRLLELSASMLHIPLENLLSSLHNKMGEDTVLREEHLNLLLKEEGIDFKSVISLMKPRQKI